MKFQKKFMFSIFIILFEIRHYIQFRFLYLLFINQVEVVDLSDLSGTWTWVRSSLTVGQCDVNKSLYKNDKILVSIPFALYVDLPPFKNQTLINSLMIYQNLLTGVKHSLLSTTLWSLLLFLLFNLWSGGLNLTSTSERSVNFTLYQS